MTLRTQTLDTSLLYLGAGYNWEPLHRFSHLCDTFLYVNLFCSLPEVRKALEEDLRDHPFLEILSIREDRSFDESTHFELHPDYRAHLLDARRQLPAAAVREYERAFSMAVMEPQWIIEAQILRKGTGRRLRLLYMTAEGMASYIALTHNGRFAPKVLVTIQTGCLEMPNGLMSDILERSSAKPEIWVRGFEPDHWDHRNPSLSARDRNYDVTGGDFLFPWKPRGAFVGYADTNGRGRRYCRAFITRQTLNRLETLRFPEYDRNSILYTGLQSLPAAPEGERHLVVTSRRVRESISLDPSLHVQYWESLFRIQNEACSMQVPLEHLRRIDATGRYDHIYFTPLGMEDEGLHLDAFLHDTHHARMLAVVHRPIDLLDLRIRRTEDQPDTGKAWLRHDKVGP